MSVTMSERLDAWEGGKPGRGASLRRHQRRWICCLSDGASEVARGEAATADGAVAAALVDAMPFDTELAAAMARIELFYVPGEFGEVCLKDFQIRDVVAVADTAKKSEDLCVDLELCLEFRWGCVWIEDGRLTVHADFGWDPEDPDLIVREEAEVDISVETLAQMRAWLSVRGES